jgi:hypothetical protein
VGVRRVPLHAARRQGPLAEDPIPALLKVLVGVVGTIVTFGLGPAADHRFPHPQTAPPAPWDEGVGRDRPFVKHSATYERGLAIDERMVGRSAIG